MQRARTAPLVAILIASPGAAQVFRPVDNSYGDKYKISVNVGLAVLPIAVTDRRNHPVSGLKKESFRVYEDRRPQEIALFEDRDIPVTVGLVVDNSGSMAGKRSQVMAAALSFAKSCNPHDEMFVVNFNQTASFGLPASVPYTSKLEQLGAALSQTSASGQTALYDAVVAALIHLKTGTSARKYLIVVSDGGDNASRHSFSDALAMAKASDATIYAVGLLDENYADPNPGVLKRLAKLTGGDSFFPQSVAEVINVLQLVARDIRQQYTIGYIPTNRAYNGKFRTIRVTVSAPGYGKLHVRTRAGYLAAPTPAQVTLGMRSLP